jgi:hypothetical protein
MDFVRLDNPPAKACNALKETYEAYSDDLSDLQVPGVPGLSNAVKKDAASYISSTMNSIHQHGSNRLAGLVKAELILEGIYTKGMVRPIVTAVESGYDFPGSNVLPESIKQLIYKYRKLYIAKGLDGKFGFAINDTKKTTRQHKFHRVLEIYWEIENDMDGLALRARTAGWTVNVTEDDHEEGLDEHDIDGADEEVMEEADEAGTSKAAPKLVPVKKEKIWRRQSRGLLPVNRMQQRYARIDAECWSRHLRQRLIDIGMEIGNDDDLMSMFVEGGTYRMDVRKMRSKRKGYRLGITLCTNGTGLITNYANATKVQSSGSLVTDYIPNARDRVIGVDPGRVNIMSCCMTLERDVDLPRGEVGAGRQASEFMTLTRNQYYEESGINVVAAKTEARKLTHSRVAHEALSQTRKKTVKTAEFREYVRCLGTNKADFDATYNSRNALGDKFSLYEGKLRSKDRFISSFGTHADVAGEGRLIVAVGDATFASTGSGERSVPTTALKKRMVTAHRQSFDTVDVGEHNTTQGCSECHEITSVCHRLKVVDGVEKWVKDRDVRRCNSPQCLESQHPCSAEPRLLIGLREWEAGEAGVIDRNPSLTMARLCGLENHERPAVFQRRGHGPVNNVPPG